jgi:hypothetical protein
MVGKIGVEVEGVEGQEDRGEEEEDDLGGFDDPSGR